MLAYKAFKPGLVCMGYQFKMGLNTTDKANCRSNGFHCAENPLDCLTYYPRMNESEYCIVDASGDLDEDDDDTKIACTELNIIKRLTREELFLHSLAFMTDRPLRENSSKVAADRARASNGYTVVRGPDPLACGELGDILAFAKESSDGKMITQVAVARVDGEKLLPGTWYDVNLTER